jgi:hypothetical protein
VQIKRATLLQHLVAITLFILAGFYNDFFILSHKNLVIEIIMGFIMLLDTASNLILISIFRLWASSSIAGDVIIVRINGGGIKFTLVSDTIRPAYGSLTTSQSIFEQQEANRLLIKKFDQQQLQL